MDWDWDCAGPAVGVVAGVVAVIGSGRDGDGDGAGTDGVGTDGTGVAVADCVAGSVGTMLLSGLLPPRLGFQPVSTVHVSPLGSRVTVCPEATELVVVSVIVAVFPGASGPDDGEAVTVPVPPETETVQ